VLRDEDALYQRAVYNVTHCDALNTQNVLGVMVQRATRNVLGSGVGVNPEMLVVLTIQLGIVPVQLIVPTQSIFNCAPIVSGHLKINHAIEFVLPGFQLINV